MHDFIFELARFCELNANFQKFRKQLLELIEDYNKDFEILSMFGIEMSINKGDYNKVNNN